MPVDEEGVNNFFSKNGGEIELPAREGRFALLITAAFSEASSSPYCVQVTSRADLPNPGSDERSSAARRYHGETRMKGDAHERRAYRSL